MNPSIPASAIVSVAPSVLSAGGLALNLNGLILTTDAAIPIGSVTTFSSAADAESFFGALTTEASMASEYFQGFDNSNAKPNQLLYSQYNTAHVAAYLRGGKNLLTLDQVKDIKNVAVTASIGGTVTAEVGAEFTGSGAGTVLSASAVTGLINPGDIVSGSGVPAGTRILNQINGTPQGAGDYTTSLATTVSGACTSTSTIMDVTVILTGTLQPGDAISGSGVTGGTTVVSQITGTAGSTGTYRISVGQNVLSTTVTSLSTTMNVTVAASVPLVNTLLLTGSSVASGSRVVSQISGTTGGIGNYVVSLASTTVSETITGHYDLSVTVDGSAATTTGVDLSTSTSFSAAAALIQVAIGAATTYDSQRQAFVITSATTGNGSTITFGTGGLATALNWTAALGAVTSQGLNATTPAAAMAAITAVTQNWATFSTAFNPDNSGNANKVLFAQWVNTTNNRYAYVAWDTDVTATQANATTCLGQILKANGSSGTIPIYTTTDAALAAFEMGAIASIDFSETQGRATMAFKSQAGLTASIVDQTLAANALENGYNFYGTYATANDQFTFFYNGQISGAFKWIDSYVNQIWMNSQFQLALMSLLTSAKSIPYNSAGTALIGAALNDPIQAALNFGAIQPNTPLSSAQAEQVNTSAGINIAGTLGTRGWFLQVKVATPQVRAARQSPPCTFWYMDGGSVQQINLASIVLQ